MLEQVRHTTVLINESSITLTRTTAQRERKKQPEPFLRVVHGEALHGLRVEPRGDRPAVAAALHHHVAERLAERVKGHVRAPTSS